MSNATPTPKRRHRTAAEKARIVAEYELTTSPIERAALMRREGVYSSILYNWRKQINGDAMKSKKPSVKTVLSDAEKNRKLERENQQLRARAERAEDMVETLGKVHALLQNAVDKSVTEKQRSEKPL